MEQILAYFEIFESYLIHLHNYIKINLEIQFPLDLMVFIAFGFIFYHFVSYCKKDTYIYNSHGNNDISATTNNVNYKINHF